MNQFQAYGSCYPNKGNKIMDVSGLGPLVVSCQQFISEDNDEDFLLSFAKQDSNGRFVDIVVSDIGGTAQETFRDDEDTGYDGTGSQYEFSGQALNNTPVVPGSVVVLGGTPAACPDLQDIYADGVLYTMDDDLAEAGSINYETGDLVLDYGSAAKAPDNLHDILCDYYSGTWLTTLGNRLITLTGTPLRTGESIRIFGLSKVSVNKTVRVDVSAVFGW